MVNKIKNIAFVVLSCDAYCDLWDLYIKSFEENWADCPFDCYFISNNKSIINDTFEFICVGEESDWSSTVINIVEKIQSRYSYVMLTFEDLPLIGKVHTELLCLIISEFIELKGNYLKFVSKPYPNKRVNKHFGEIYPGSLYRTTCVYAIWDVSLLSKLLSKGENPWQFERYASVRSDKYPSFYGVYNNVFKFVNIIIKGKLVRSELKKSKYSYLVTGNRTRFSIFEEYIFKIKSLIFKVFVIAIPWNMRRAIVFKAKNL
jgi:hypothetical protein